MKLKLDWIFGKYMVEEGQIKESHKLKMNLCTTLIGVCSFIHGSSNTLSWFTYNKNGLFSLLFSFLHWCCWSLAWRLQGQPWVLFTGVRCVLESWKYAIICFSIITIGTALHACIEMETLATLFFMVNMANSMDCGHMHPMMTTMSRVMVAILQLIPSHAALVYSEYLCRASDISRGRGAANFN